MDQRVDQQVEPPLGVALGRTLDLAQQVATDEIRLLQLETLDRVSEVMRRGMWIGSGALCLAVAWVAAWVAVVVALERWFPLEQRLALLVISQIALGSALIGFALRNRRAVR